MVLAVDYNMNGGKPMLPNGFLREHTCIISVPELYVGLAATAQSQ